MRLPSRLVLAACAASLALAACVKKVDTNPVPAVPNVVPATPLTAPVALTPSGAASDAVAQSGSMAGASSASSALVGSTPGAEMGTSPAMGPGNATTAVGGMAGGQAAGGQHSGKPTPTSGDGATAAGKAASN
ncbi:MAG: hypothetical protein M3Z16_02180 [Pseudomonadota bacterium]|nr:hypothetical protein [Pseudomonadota bacterium]